MCIMQTLRIICNVIATFSGIPLALYVSLRSRECYVCDKVKVGKAWSKTSQKVDVGQQGGGVALLHVVGNNSVAYSTTQAPPDGLLMSYG